ncbi:MAG: hypothetical protein IK121_02480 [Lachnospiraceae bacterium]|nr:hypothetical protein [Lachnospiraceae bacterium]
MHFEPIDRKDIPKKTKRVGPVLGDLVSTTVNAFIASEHECAEIVDDWGVWANSNNFRRSFQSYLDDHNIKQIMVTIRGDRVFLIKEKKKEVEV